MKVKMSLRRISLLLACFTACLLFMAPFQTAAEDSGKMQLKIDRIDQQQEQEYKNVETELEKKFPDLLKKETQSVIRTKQKEEKTSMEKLEQSLFTTDIKADTTLEDTKASLFNEDYTAPKTSTSDVQEEEDNAIISKVLYTALAVLASILCVGVYMMMRKISD